MNGAQITRLADGRLHLHHGPIDLLCQAWGSPAAVTEGYRRGAARFAGVLAELVAELPGLRGVDMALNGPIARKMAQAVAPFRPVFITPMAAVAGAVADAVLAAMVLPEMSRAYVNNGGDIALHLTPGARLTCALGLGGTAGPVVVRYQDRVRGIATSGWRGRSWSLGIADSVTVLADSAAKADAAATMIANAVDLPHHPAIARRPADQLQAETDLGTRLVTVGVGLLTAAEVGMALTRGENLAQMLRRRGLVEASALFLQDEMRAVGALGLKEPLHA